LGGRQEAVLLVSGIISWYLLSNPNGGRDKPCDKKLVGFSVKVF